MAIEQLERFELGNHHEKGDWLLFRDRGTGSFLQDKKQPVPEKVACPRSAII
jgi:hypothetical protein